MAHKMTGSELQELLTMIENRLEPTLGLDPDSSEAILREAIKKE